MVYVLVGLVLLYAAGLAWTFVRSGGAVVYWTWPLRAFSVLVYLLRPSRD